MSRNGDFMSVGLSHIYRVVDVPKTDTMLNLFHDKKLGKTTVYSMSKKEIQEYPSSLAITDGTFMAISSGVLTSVATGNGLLFLPALLLSFPFAVIGAKKFNSFIWPKKETFNEVDADPELVKFFKDGNALPEQIDFDLNFYEKPDRMIIQEYKNVLSESMNSDALEEENLVKDRTFSEIFINDSENVDTQYNAEKDNGSKDVKTNSKSVEQASELVEILVNDSEDVFETVQEKESESSVEKS